MSDRVSKASAITVCASLVLFLGGLVFQRCSFERKLAAAQAQSTKADAQLVTATEELATEHVAEAKTQAVTTVRAAQQRVAQEVTSAEGDSLGAGAGVMITALLVGAGFLIGAVVAASVVGWAIRYAIGRGLNW